MYQLTIDLKEQTLASKVDMRRWINRGKIEESTLIQDMQSGIEKTAGDWLNEEKTRDTDSKEKAQEGLADPTGALMQILTDLENSDPMNFTQEDLDELTAFAKSLKKYDIDGRIDWMEFNILRKHISRIKRALLQKKSAIILEEESYPSESTSSQQWVEAHPIITSHRPQPGRLDTPTGYRKIPSPGDRYKGPPGPEADRGEEKPKAWFHSKMIIIGALIFAAPLGLILLWTSPLKDGYSITSRIVLSIIFGSALINGWSEKGIIFLKSILPGFFG